MKAGVFLGDGVVSIEERPEPALVRPDDVLIDVEACGICGTDLHILDVPPGHPAAPGVVLGHEFVGIVREIGPESVGVEVGDRVAVVTDLSCGRCAWCRRGLFNHCENFRSLGVFEDGGLAPLAVAPAAACHPISANLPREIAALTEPIACVVNAVQRARLVPGESVALFGGGPIGLIFTGLFRAAGAGRIAVVEPVPTRREIASALGADLCIDPGATDPTDAIRAFTAAEGTDVVVDAVGSQLAAALGSVRRAGRVLLFGMNERATASIRQYDITRNEVTILGTFVGTHMFPKAIRILEGGLVDWRPMVTHLLPLDDLPRAVDLLRAGEAVKVVIDLIGERSNET